MKEGMPLFWRKTPEEIEQEKTMTVGQKVKKFLRRRLFALTLLLGLATPIAGTFIAAGGDVNRIFPPTPGPVLLESEQQNPWPNHVKRYASVSQNDVSPNLFFTKGGCFARGLMQAFHQHNSLDDAFQSVAKGYGGFLVKRKAVCSVEGPSIFNKVQEHTRVAILISGGGINDKGEDMTEDLRADTKLIQQTLHQQYHMRLPGEPDNGNPSQIIVLDKPSVKQLQEVLEGLRKAPPDELLIYISSEGASLKSPSIAPELAHKEGAKIAGFFINDNTSVFEDEFKKLVSEATRFQTPDGKQKVIQTAIVGDFCGSGAMIQ